MLPGAVIIPSGLVLRRSQVETLHLVPPAAANPPLGMPERRGVARAC
jgi:hypothetical protein